jgi:hypothetical protein
MGLGVACSTGWRGVLRDESWLDPTIVSRTLHAVNRDFMKEEMIRVMSP